MPLLYSVPAPHSAIINAVVLLFLASVVWAFFDARKRGRSGVIAALVVALLAWPVSLLAWLLFRPTRQAENSRESKTMPQIAMVLDFFFGQRLLLE